VIIGGDFRLREIFQIPAPCRWRRREPGPFGVIVTKVT
jgi:hypothetical protein